MRERGHLVGHQADALAAVDIALWDLTGRLTGRRVVDLLGGAFREEIPTYLSTVLGTTETESAARATQLHDDGIRAVKLHIGHGVEVDLATVRAVRDAVQGMRVAVDVHGVYGVPDALRLARGLEELGAWFLESPLLPEDLRGHAELSARAGLPIAAGEALRNRFEYAQWLDARALRIAQPDVARTGLTEAMSIVEACDARHVPVAPHHAGSVLGVGLAAGLHLSAAIPTLTAFEYQPPSVDAAARMLEEPLPVGPASMQLPEGPGLGIEVDVDAVRSFAA